MMVRLDKILHMITCFKSVTSGLEDDQYSVPPENIEISTSSARVMKRMGAVSTHIDIKLNKKNPIAKDLFTKKYKPKIIKPKKGKGSFKRKKD